MKKSFASARQSRFALCLVTMLVALFLAVGVFNRTAKMQSGEPQAGTTSLFAERVSEKIKGGNLQVNAKEKTDPEAATESRPVAAVPNAVEVASNYTFVTATNASLTDMSTGTTTLLAANLDDTASPLTSIGFDFYFQGTRFAQFGVNENGVLRLGAAAQAGAPYQPLAQAGLSIITAYGADQRTHAGDGKVHFKVIGAAPDRTLVVEWLNTQSNFNSGGTADLTYQVRLSETTGIIEFVYGSMTMSTLGAADVNSQDPNIGFSSSNVAGAVGSVTAAQSGAPAPTFDGTSATAVGNLYTAGTIPALTSAANGSRRIFSFTPPQTPTAPTGLTFTGITPSAMTLNWTDSPNEVSYAIYNSTDGVNFSFVGAAAQNATSFNATLLSPSTTYFWRVFAVSEGALSTALAGSQVTSAPGSISAVAAGGNWSAPATWVGGVVPTSSDAVTIVDGATVTIDTAANCFSLTVGQGTSGVLQFEVTTARTLTALTNVTIATGGVFQSAASGTQTGHVLSLGGNLTNNGVLDFNTNPTFTPTGQAGAGIIFTGAASNTFGGTGPTTDIQTLTINKGTSNANVLELNPSNFTVLSSSTDVAGFLTLTNGTLKMSGNFAGTNRVFTAAAYTIGATTGFWLNNPNYIVAAQAGNAVNNGLFRLTLGTFNQGTLVSHSFRGGTGAVFTIEGGTLNCAAQFSPQNAVTYNQSGGTVNVGLVGNSQSNFGTFELFSAAAIFNMTGGTIVLNQASTGATPIDYQNLAVATAFGGTLRAGTGTTVTNFNFRLRGNVPNLVIDNTTNNKTATATALIDLLGNTTINTGTTMVINGQVCLVQGSTFTNNGTLTGTAASTRYYFLGGLGATTYTGTGVVTAPLVSWEVDNIAGVTIDPAVNQIVTARFNNFSGGLTGSGKLTLGNGGVTTAVVQLGVAGVTQTVTGFDVPPVFNPGTGGVILLYAPELTGRTTGNEMPPSRTLTTLSITNTNPITIAGGDVMVNGAGAGALALGAPRLITGANTLYFNSAAGTVTRTTGYVDGNFKKAYAANASKIFEVGTANGFSPVTVNVTAGAPADFTVTAIQGPDPAVNPATSIQRYWALVGPGITADLTFQYLVGDVMGTEANYKLIREVGGTAVAFPASIINVGAHTAALTAVSNFSNWTVGEITSPTAAPASISGVVTRSDGNPLGGVTVSLGGGQLNGGRRTITNSYGQYRFDNVATESFYVVTPGMANYGFNPASRSFTLLANKADAVFTATAMTPTENPLNVGDFFVRQQYLDFLGREPDMQGWLFWTGQIASCGTDQNCVRQKRLDVSAAFFMSDEFQLSGNYVYRLYRAALGRQLTFAEFTDDHQKVIGGADLEANRTKFADDFVQRPEFVAKYQNAALAETFVEALLQGMLADAQVDLSSQREALIAAYNTGGDVNHSRSAALRAAAERSEFKTAVYNKSFVVMEYYGYLRRDFDEDGLTFWVNVLNNRDLGNYRGMVCSFITSAEYQQRFSPIVTHSNSECQGQ